MSQIFQKDISEIESPKIKKLGMKKQKFQQNLKSGLKENQKVVLEILDSHKGVHLKKLLQILAHYQQQENISKEFILEKLNEKSNKNERTLYNNLEPFNALVQKGYQNPSMIVKALKKNGGDLEKAEEFLKFKQEKFQNKNKFNQQIVFLLQQDVENPLMIKKALKKARGDQNLALELLQDMEKLRNFKFNNKIEKKQRKINRKDRNSQNKDNSEIQELLSELNLEQNPDKNNNNELLSSQL